MNCAARAVARHGARTVLFALACIGLGACSALPTQGPDAEVVVSARPANPDKVQYVLVDLTPSIVARVRQEPNQTLGGVFTGRGGAPDLKLGVGDVIAVTIFEAASGGLFIPSEAGARAGNFVAIPNQEIGKDGTIEVPYAGSVQAAGLTVGEVKATIESRLRNRAIEPQAVVSLIEGRSSLVSVTGEVNTSIRYILTKTGERVLDAITRAGGPKYPGYETYVTLQRGGRKGKVYFNRLVDEPSNNIYLRPGDSIVLNREFRSFMALGASGQNGQINFDNETLTLSQAIGKSGGVLDSRGDPTQSFLYRMEPKKLVAEMGYDVTPFITPMVPVIYRVNLREPDGFFLATKFQMRDQDVLFVSNAASVELSKVLQLLQLNGNTALIVNSARLIR